MVAKSRKSIFITLASVLLLAFVLITYRAWNVYLVSDATLTFRNISNQSIVEAEISLAGQSCKFGKLAVGAETQCKFTELHDSSYNVVITLESGEVVTNESMGYVTHGMSFDDVITLNEAGELKLESTIRDI